MRSIDKKPKAIPCFKASDNDIYMKIPKWHKMHETYNPTSWSMYSIKLQRSLYGLKQSKCMWYNRLSEYFLKEGFENNPICLWVFIKSKSRFAIVAVYVDDLNLVRAPEELTKTANCLKNEFEMKDLGKTKFCLGLQIKHLLNEILVHQSAYTEKSWSKFTWIKPILWALQWWVGHLMSRKIRFDHKKMMKKLLVLKYHILVQLVFWCILQITHDLI